MTKLRLLAVLGFLLVFGFGFVGMVLADPLPMGSLWEGKPVQYLSVVFAEFCGLLAGASVLSYKAESRWRKAAFNVLIAVVVSYVIGVAVWSWAYAAGLLLYNPVNPFFNYSPHALGWVVLVLPEFIGTAVGTVLIRVNEKSNWKTSFLTMTAAMVTSFLVGMLIVNIYLRALQSSIYPQRPEWVSPFSDEVAAFMHRVGFRDITVRYFETKVKMGFNVALKKLKHWHVDPVQVKEHLREIKRYSLEYPMEHLIFCRK